MSDQTGRVILLNGTPRSGKSSIVAAIKTGWPEPWIEMGVDVSNHAMLPAKYRPGIGLRPGGERPDLEPLVVSLYRALLESIAVHAREGLDVVAEFGLHADYAGDFDARLEAAERLKGLPVLLVGVRCPLSEIMHRRKAGQTGREGLYLGSTPDGDIPAPVLRFDKAVHAPGVYDLEVDTSVLSPGDCAATIRARLESESRGTALWKA